MTTKLLTIKQYISKVKPVSRQAILQAIKEKKPLLLPRVVSYKKIGRDWVLEVTD